MLGIGVSSRVRDPAYGCAFFQGRLVVGNLRQPRDSEHTAAARGFTDMFCAAR